MEEEIDLKALEEGTSGRQTPVENEGANKPYTASHLKSKHASEHHHFHLGKHGPHRFHHLAHPTGKIFHVVHSPQEADAKRTELSKASEHSTDFDVLLYGSPEHVTCIKEVHEHHMSLRESLRVKNAELFEEFDQVHNTLEHLNDELKSLTTNAVALDASFSKFGYSAHLRTTDDDDNISTRSGISGAKSAEERHLDKYMEPLRFWKRPTVRQYFHKGLLWRSARSGEVGSFELFCDLIYVGVIDTIGETAVTNPSGESFLHFVLIFSLGYKIWSDLTVVINWFEVEDVVGRLVILFILCCLYGFNSNIEFFFDDTYTAAMSFNLMQRLCVVALFLFVGCTNRMIRGSLLLHVAYAAITAAIYITSIHVSYWVRIALLFTGITIDYLGGNFVLWLSTKTAKMSTAKQNSRLYNLIRENFEFFPAINIEHRVERTQAFTTLIFGYSILRSLYQSRDNIGVNAFLGKGILVTVQAFTIMWMYFDIDGGGIHVHAIRRSYKAATAYILLHLPLFASFTLASSAVGNLVIAHDCGDANVQDLAPTYMNESKAQISQAWRWFYSSGLGLTLICMTLISMTHDHKALRSPRASKNTRLAFRFVVALILIFLPLAKNRLNSLEIIGTTTALFACVLIFDIYGISCEGDNFWTGPDAGKAHCHYSAKIKLGRRVRRELEEKLKRGEDVTLWDALRRSRTGSMTAKSETTPMTSQDTLVGQHVDAEWHGGHL